MTETTISGQNATPSIRPGRLVLRLLPLGVATMLVIDRALGDTAEFYNAHRLVGAWGRVLTGNGIAGEHPFLMGQEQMGDPAALAVGTGLLFVEPAVVLAVVVYPVSWLWRRRTARVTGPAVVGP